MPKYAYLENVLNENNEIIDKTVVGVYDLLPTSWNNISNFHLLENDLDQLKSYNWYTLVLDTQEIDTFLYYVSSESYNYNFEADTVVQTLHLQLIPPPINIPSENLYSNIDELRAERTRRMHDFEWRYSRYDRQVRLGVTPTDSLEKMDEYMQALADITNQGLGNIIWPEYVSTDNTVL